MGIFAVLLLMPMLIQHVIFSNKCIDYERKNKRALLFFFAMLTVLVAFRHESIGNDTRPYIYLFNKFAKMPWDKVGKESLEIGFSYYTKFVSLFSREVQVYFAITAMVTIGMIYPTYKRLCLDTSLTVVLFCSISTFVMMFSGIRQMLAIGIGFRAYEFVRNKKLLPFISTVLLAMTFHTSAFMLAFMYPIYHTQITKKWLYAVIPVLIIVFIFNRQVFALLTAIISRFTRFEGEITSTGAVAMLLLFGLFTVFAFLIPDETKLDKETIGLRNFLLLALLLQMFAPLHTLAMRMNYYYIIFVPLLLPKIIEAKSDQWQQVAVVGRYVMVVFFLIYFFITNANGGGGLNVFPYHFFWENVR